MAKRILVAGGAMIGIGLSRRFAAAWRPLAVLFLIGVVAPAALAAQSQRCRILCAPELKIEPTIIFALDVPHADPADCTDS